MSERDLVTQTKSNAVEPTGQPRLSRAKFFKIQASLSNYGQYAATIRAYAVAGMPFEHIANAGELLGDPVERGEIDVPIQLPKSSTEKVGEVAEDESKIRAWQNRGEQITVTPQLIHPASKEERDLVTASQNLDQKTLNVIEGISAEISTSHTSQISSGNTDNFRFIRPLTDEELKKAA